MPAKYLSRRNADEGAIRIMKTKRLARASGLPLVLLALVAAAPDPQGVSPEPWGYDLSALDRSANPGDSFDDFANGAWKARVKIPDDRQSWSVGAIGQELVSSQLRTLLEQAAAQAPRKPVTEQQKIGAYYASFMDEARVERLGLSPLKAELDAIRATTTREALAARMGRTNEGFDGSLFAAQVFPDLRNPEMSAPYIGQAGLGLPDRDYYLKPEFREKKDAYQSYVAKLLGLAGWPAAEAQAAAVVAFETRVAEASWSKVEQRDVTRLYNPRTLAQLQKDAPGFAWAPFLKAVGFPDKVVVAEVTAIPKIAAIFGATPVETLKARAAFTLIDNAAVFLSSSFANAYFDFHGATLGGAKVIQPRWKRAVHAVSGGDFLYGERSEYFGAMGWAVGDAYVARHFPPQSKAAIEALVANLRTAFRARIEKTEWMAPATKAEALRKLAAIRIKVGYPDTPRRNYASLAIDPADLIGNVRRAGAFEWQVQRRFIGKPVDKGEWAMTPQTIDAYNGGPSNEIVFPAAILQPLEFDAGYDAAINYGDMGSIIGHELTHSFDDQGRMLDATGALRDWWSASDAATYTARAKVLGAQYSAYEPVPGAHINGDLTMGENIADLGGVLIALDAYHASLGGKEAPVIAGFTGDQRFFLGYAQGWRGVARPDAIAKQIASDPHSPRRYRIDGVVRNVDAWYTAFGIQPGTKLYLAPEARARVW